MEDFIADDALFDLLRIRITSTVTCSGSVLGALMSIPLSAMMVAQTNADGVRCLNVLLP